MIRILLLGLCLATLGGCSSTPKTKVTNGESPDPPKQYEYRDMAQGGSAVIHQRAGNPTMVR